MYIMVRDQKAIKNAPVTTFCPAAPTTYSALEYTSGLNHIIFMIDVIST
jgi:hypothetical protein